VDALAGTGLPLGIVPLGTGNLLAATLGISRDPIKAANRLATAEPMTIDTGLLTTPTVSESFAVAAGLGFDARLMAATSSALKARLGVMAYFATALRMLPSLPAAQTELVIDGRHYELSAVVVFVANCGQILPGYLGPRAPLDPTDGLLDVVVVRSGTFPIGWITAGRSAIDSLLRTEMGSGGASLRLRGADISVTTDPPEPIQVDGDPLPGVVGSFRARARPQSLTVLV
jgi:diacylglycerol kinase family enzyme